MSDFDPTERIHLQFHSTAFPAILATDAPGRATKAAAAHALFRNRNRQLRQMGSDATWGAVISLLIALLLASALGEFATDQLAYTALAAWAVFGGGTLQWGLRNLARARYIETGGWDHMVVAEHFTDSEHLNEQLREAGSNGQLAAGITYDNSRIKDDLLAVAAEISGLLGRLEGSDRQLAVTVAFLARAIHTNEKTRCRHAINGQIDERNDLTREIDRQRTKLDSALTAVRQAAAGSQLTPGTQRYTRPQIDAAPAAGLLEEARIDAHLDLNTAPATVTV